MAEWQDLMEPGRSYTMTEFVELIAPLYAQYKELIHRCASGLSKYAAGLAVQGQEDQVNDLRKYVLDMEDFWYDEYNTGSAGFEANHEKNRAAFDREVTAARMSGQCPELDEQTRQDILAGLDRYAKEMADNGDMEEDVAECERLAESLHAEWSGREQQTGGGPLSKVFEVYLRSGDSELELSLPATDYELLDALERLRVRDDGAVGVEIVQYGGCGFLHPFLDGDTRLLELNALARQLSHLTAEQTTAFAGLVQTDADERPGISTARLRDLAASAAADCCRVVQAPPVPGEVPAPDYAILLEVSKGFFHDPGYDGDKALPLKLPADESALSAVLDELGAASWLEVGWECKDCKAPGLVDAFSGGEEFSDVIRLSEQLAGVDTDKLTKYKAVVAATKCNTVSYAVFLADCLEDFILSPNILTPKDMALDELKVAVDDATAGLLVKHLDLDGYGRDLLSRYHSILTGYGLLGCKDCMTIDQVLERHRQPQGGMQFEQSL